MHHEVMTRKNKLKTFFDSDHTSIEKIEMYESNISFFNELLKSQKIEEANFVLPIKLLSYVVALRNEGFYKKCLTIIAELENELDLLKGRSDSYKGYLESLLFSKGVCLRKLHMYKKSNSVFSILLKMKPDNDRYVEWYNFNRADILERYASPILYSLLGLGLTGIIIGYLGYNNQGLKIFANLSVLFGLITYGVLRVGEKLIEKGKL
jgi:hypothetical protein